MYCGGGPPETGSGTNGGGGGACMGSWEGATASMGGGFSPPSIGLPSAARFCWASYSLRASWNSRSYCSGYGAADPGFPGSP